MREVRYDFNENGKLLGRSYAKASGVAFSLATIVPVFLAFLVLRIVTLITASYETKNWFLYLNFLLPQISFAIVAAWFLYYLKITPKQAVVSQKCRVSYFLLATALQFGLLSLSELNDVFLGFLGKFGYVDNGIILPSMDGFGFVGVLIVVAILPAVFEEVFFRGVLLRGLRSFGTVGAVLLCGGLFALYHQNPAQTLYQFCCGAAFALLAVRAGSILPSVVSHFLNNAFILILYKMEIATIPTGVFVPFIILSAISLVFSLVYLVFFAKKNKTACLEKTEEKTEEKSERGRFLVCSATGIVLCVFIWLTTLVSGFGG